MLRRLLINEQPSIDTDTDTSVVNPTRRPQPTNLQNLVTIMESEVRVATFEG